MKKIQLAYEYNNLDRYKNKIVVVSKQTDTLDSLKIYKQP